MQQTATLDLQRADFGMVRGLVERVILEDKGIQEHWMFSKEKMLKVQEQIDSMC